jgi:hypothetical protein
VSKIKTGLSYANVTTTLALFIALGGGAYAAVTLPRHSVGAVQLKANAVTSSKVKDRSLLARDFKANQLQQGNRGPEGAPGATGPQGLPGPRGPQGDAGPQGPGAMSYDMQFDNDQVFHTVASVNGVNVLVGCGSVTGAIIEVADAGAGIYGWGTREQGGSGAITPATVIAATGTDPAMLEANGPAFGNLDVVAGATGKWARFDFSVIRGSRCNLHGLITPPS